MNREERRLAQRLARRKGRAVWRPKSKLSKPPLHSVDAVFSPIEGFLAQLSTGEVLASRDGQPIHQDHTGEAYIATDAMRGWLAVMCKLISHYRVGIDLLPIAKMCSKLDVGMPITPEQVRQCQGIVDRCREAFRHMDPSLIISTTETELIRNQMEALGHVEH